MQYHPITDSFKLITQQRELLNNPEFTYIYPSLDSYLTEMENQGVSARRDLHILLSYLINVIGNAKGTQTRFRNEAERYMLFCWNEKHKSVLKSTVEDVRDYIDWLWSPPKALIADNTIASRYKAKGDSDVRLVNEAWRPFVLRGAKANRKTNAFISPERAKLAKPKQAYSLNQTSLQNSYASLNVFLKELWETELISRNPVSLVKKSCKYLVKGKIYQPPHTLDDETWQLFVDTLTTAADENPAYEKHRFLVLSLKVLFLRISELSNRDYCIPVFGHFRQDSSGEGWVLNVIGKGKKQRLVTVPDAFIDGVLVRYRESLGLSPLPHIDENMPIMPSFKTGQALHQDSLNNMVEEAFDLVIKSLKALGKTQQAHAISGASSHWLRHTGATQALAEINETMLAVELGHASVKTTVEVYVAPAHRDRIKKGVSRKL
ncbi:site-specific integrase [Paraglaciecola sp.]|uniref:tyrosine-type recombinase/integrase n=1 Tax=Paraglaciecola sp. TaxID=1920173 RepID=UPI0030F4A963